MTYSMQPFARIVAIPVLALMLAIGYAPGASAHKVVMSAYAEGPIIEGEVGFSDGAMSSDVQIEVFDDKGNKLGETKTDADGIFQFKPTQYVPHHFRANLGQGHVGTYVVELEDLPEGLGKTNEEGQSQEQNQKQAQASASEGQEGTGPSPDASAAKMDSVSGAALQAAVRSAMTEEMGALKGEIAKAVRREVKPLRKEIAAYKEKNDFQTILGGIGYILGLTGIGFYFAARRQTKAAKPDKTATKEA